MSGIKSDVTLACSHCGKPNKIELRITTLGGGGTGEPAEPVDEFERLRERLKAELGGEFDVWFTGALWGRSARGVLKVTVATPTLSVGITSRFGALLDEFAGEPVFVVSPDDFKEKT